MRVEKGVIRVIKGQYGSGGPLTLRAHVGLARQPEETGESAR